MVTTYNGIGRAIVLLERPLEPPREKKPPTESREDQLDYCRDFFSKFVEYAESYVPAIVDEFCRLYPWQFKDWEKNGVTIGGKINGSKTSC